MLLTVIPARAGSQRLRNKHWLQLGDRFVIDWTLRHVPWLLSLGPVIVSTDDDAILRRAAKHFPDAGDALMLHRRPDALCQSTSSMAGVVADAMTTAIAASVAFTGVLLLQATSPFRRQSDIQRALELFPDFGPVVSVSCSRPPEWLRSAQASQVVEGVFTGLRPLCPGDGSSGIGLDNERAGSDRPVYVRPNGAVYLTARPAEPRHYRAIPAHAVGMAMDSLFSIDIDTMDDFRLAQAIAASGACS